MTECEVLVFARVPLEGTVKTRLATTVGPAQALAIYRTLASTVLSAICQPDRKWSVTLVYTPDTDEAPLQLRQWFASMPPRPVSVDRLEPQCAGDLGARMQHAIANALTRAKKAVVIGTDCPGVDAITISETIARLDDNDCVLGPAEDGGYYLIATTRSDLPVFHEMTWSTEKVYSETIQRLSDANVSVATLDVKRDVDTEQDWLAVQTMFPSAK